jgi:hypothetical protein
MNTWGLCGEGLVGGLGGASVRLERSVGSGAALRIVRPDGTISQKMDNIDA